MRDPINKYELVRCDRTRCRIHQLKESVPGPVRDLEPQLKSFEADRSDRARFQDPINKYEFVR